LLDHDQSQREPDDPDHGWFQSDFIIDQDRQDTDATENRIDR
jgi:hypothetical protein